MTLTTVGFDGAITEAQWAAKARNLGSTLPVVLGINDFAVSINAAATRTVTVAIAPNGAERHGLTTTSDAVVSVVLDDVTTSGQSRWDAIVLHSDWTTNTVTVTKVNGTAAVGAVRVQPAGIANTPGTTHDQVLALVQITNGLTVPTAVANRRIWQGKSHLGGALDELPPATAGLYGTEVRLLDGSRYRCLIDSSSNPAWIKDAGGVVSYSGGSVIVTAANWTAGSPLVQRGLVKDGNAVQVDIAVRRLTSGLTSTSDGNFPNTVIGTIGSALRPDITMPVPLLYIGGTSLVGLAGMATLDPDGTLTLQSGAPNSSLPNRTTTTDYSIRASITFGRS